jgi:hypothetical protein
MTRSWGASLLSSGENLIKFITFALCSGHETDCMLGKFDGPPSINAVLAALIFPMERHP